MTNSPILIAQSESEPAPQDCVRADFNNAVRLRRKNIRSIVQAYQNENEQRFLQDLVKIFQNDREQFLYVAKHTTWSDTALLEFARRLRIEHAQDPAVVQWVNATLMASKGEPFQKWQLFWATLTNQWDVVKEYLHRGVPSDDIFTLALSSQNTSMFYDLLPYAKSTLQDPIYTLTFLHHLAYYDEDFSKIDALMQQYSIQEVLKAIEAVPSNHVDEIFRSYVVQYALKNLSAETENAVKTKKM